MSRHCLSITRRPPACVNESKLCGTCRCWPHLYTASHVVALRPYTSFSFLHHSGDEDSKGKKKNCGGETLRFFSCRGQIIDMRHDRGISLRLKRFSGWRGSLNDTRPKCVNFILHDFKFVSRACGVQISFSNIFSKRSWPPQFVKHGKKNASSHVYRSTVDFWICSQKMINIQPMLGNDHLPAVYSATSKCHTLQMYVS